MNTSILTVVLAGAMLAGQNGSPTWQTDYTTAQRVGAQQQKPVLVVVGNGANGWQQAIPNASAHVTQLMAQKYVCVYVDTATTNGKLLAYSLEIHGAGLVISDRTGSYQAFWHQGDMTSDVLAQVLARYSDPNSAVRTTETNTSRTSFYPSNGFQPANYAPTFRPAASC
jgi:hypothetical protein